MLDGDNLRRLPLIERKARLCILLAYAPPGLRYCEHLDGNGATVFRHACAFGLEGIVSKRKDAVYRSGRSRTWLKAKHAGYERRSFSGASKGSRRVLDGLWSTSHATAQGSDTLAIHVGIV
jgi:ATP-dependent DNA ligase